MALRLGVAMTALQFAIGALNDLVDAPRDAGRKPDKPIPAGDVSVRTARLVVAIGLLVGLALSAASGPVVLSVAAIGAASGVVYDLRLKGTPWAWIAFAVGIPLLLVYAWLGATGSLPAPLLVLLPLAAIAGAAIAIGNAIVDVDRDRAARTITPAVVLGPRRAWRMLAGLHVVIAAGALASIAVLGRGGAGFLVTAAGVIVAWAGVALARDADARIRERGWRLQAVGIATTAIGWALAVAGGVR